VLVITGLKTGGAESMLLKLLQGIDRERFTPSVISLTTHGEIGPQIAELGIPVFALHMQSSLSGLMGFVRLVKLLTRLKPDVVHTWMYHADFLGSLASRLVGITSVIWGIRHTDLSVAANKRSTLWLAWLCARLSHWIPKRILVNSQASRVAHESIGYSANKMVVIPNGFDLRCFAPSLLARKEIRSELGLGYHTLLVGVIGRFHPQKNQLGFVSAIAELHAIRPDVHFLLAGHGLDEGNSVLKAAIHEVGAAGVSHLLGLRSDIPRLMAALDVLALPSVGEAFPNVVGEAMACAVPCAVTDVGDSAWIVGETGRIVPAGNMMDLAHFILDLLELSAAERAVLGAAARERVASLFEISKVVKQYEAFYESLVIGKVEHGV
jgi:glycosyltransferase involved in cell wall biosynthesis